MTVSTEALTSWLHEMARLIQENGDPKPEHYQYFLQEPELSLSIIKILTQLDEKSLDDDESFYTACIFSLEVCIAQIQGGVEQGSKMAEKMIQELMHHISIEIESQRHSLSFWLPVLNAFYEAHVELTPDLKDAYLDLAENEVDWSQTSEADHLQSIREMIQELGTLSVFEVTENFFAQTYAMPAEFFAELLSDLYQIDEGHEIGLLMLLHPDEAVREVVLHSLEIILPHITLTPRSLTRLQTIRTWYPEKYHPQFDAWIKAQRKKGVYFVVDDPIIPVSLKASEVDGGGAQGVFIQIKEGRKKRLCGLLYKYDVGIKDAWLTIPITASEIKRYHDEAFQEDITLREIDIEYLILLTNHFLHVMQSQGSVPNIHLLHIQERLGINFVPRPLDIASHLTLMAVQISPFTQALVDVSLKRSATWPKTKEFTESWFVENERIDKYVNQHCEFVEGVRICHFDEAIKKVFENVFEHQRAYWLFHFLWLALWLKSKPKKNEKLWQDSFIIAHQIWQKIPLIELPILYEICFQSVVNSAETMQERRTHLMVEKVKKHPS